MAAVDEASMCRGCACRDLMERKEDAILGSCDRRCWSSMGASVASTLEEGHAKAEDSERLNC